MRTSQEKCSGFYFALLFAILIQFSCSTKEIPGEIMVVGVETPQISLAGSWKFTMDPPERFWENSVDFSAWEDIQVPGECQMQGFAIRHDRPYVYKTEFLVPNDYQGKHISIDFHGVYSYARVWVNGEFVREHYGGFTRWDCDVTGLVQAGEKAILTVEIVDRVDDISYGSGYAKHQIGGILRDVVLSAKPMLHFKQLFFETDLDDQFINADLKIHYVLSENSASRMKIEIFNAKNKQVASKELLEPSMEGEVVIHVEKPLTWDAEHPNLYKVITTLFEEGNEVLLVPEKIGFREIQVEGNNLLVNGRPVKLRGACRHDIHPQLGRMTTPEYDRQDVLLAKEANMNFIRTSHYPPSEAFLDFCDEFGIYVEDETAVCFVGSHRTFDYQASGASQNDPEFTGRYLSQLEEMVSHHRNHPSVIIWSIGNENVFGSNFTASYNWVKENDQTRPIIYSYPGQVPDSLRNFEILSMHYPDFKGNLNQYKVSTQGFAFEDMPVLFDEWAHVACYNNPTLRYDPNVRNFWGQSLDMMWSKLFEADGGLGGAIWCMIDETFMLPKDLEGYNDWWGKLDANVIPATYMGPTVGYGEWGIIDTWRRKKPEFWGTKKAYSPARLLVKQVKDFSPGKELSLPVHNRFDHTNFNELDISFRFGDVSGKVESPDIGPHDKGDLVLPAQQWKQGEQIYLVFRGSDGSIIDEYLVQLGEHKVILPEQEEGVLDLQENDDQLRVKGDNYLFTLNKQTGLINDLVVDGDTLIKDGPYTNLKLPGSRVQYSTIVMADYAKNWKKNTLSYDLVDGILAIHTQGSYDSISASFEIRADASGVFSIDYKIQDAPADKMIQESGLKFLTGSKFKTISWNRLPYFTIYPDNDIGRAEGQVDLSVRPKMNYREKPQHDWELDTKGFYYHGLDDTLPYTNIVRSMKENIASYGLSTGGAGIDVLSDGSQACRFDKIDGQEVLFVNDLWDYQSLLWGNYMKMIPTSKDMGGKVILKINRKD